MKKGVKFAWSPECQYALVKSILSSEPVLVAPDFSAPFKLAVDACDIGVGAVLMQTDVTAPLLLFLLCVRGCGVSLCLPES